MRARRTALNERMTRADAFFRKFGALDTEVYAKGAIGKEHKELMGLAISVMTSCGECVLCHLDGSRNEGASRKEPVEAIKTGAMARGSITFPTARFAFAVMEREA